MVRQQLRLRLMQVIGYISACGVIHMVDLFIALRRCYHRHYTITQVFWHDVQQNAPEESCIPQAIASGIQPPQKGVFCCTPLQKSV